ncbi:MAG: hypothetical protein WHV44_04060 [Anaerolineales bacterium]
MDHLSLPNGASIAVTHAARPLTRFILTGVALFLVINFILQAAYQFQLTHWFYVWLGIVILLETGLAWATVRLARLCTETAPRPALWIGSILIIGGIWIDVLSTIYKDPQLQVEANIVVRFLYAQGAPLWALYLLGFYAQAVLTVISVALWAAFLKHARTYQAVLLAMRPQFFLEFLWAAFGSQTYWAKQNHLRLSRTYRLVWLPALLGITPLDRWWLGFEWLGFVPICTTLRAWVFNGQNVLVVAAFLVWLTLTYAQNRALLRETTDPTLRPRSMRAMALGCAANTIFLTCACCAITAAAIPAGIILTSPPDGLQAELSAPAEVKLGDVFALDLTVTNTSQSPIEITHIGLRIPAFPSVLDGADYVHAFPETEYRVFDESHLLIPRRTLQPGEQTHWQVWLYAKRPGKYSVFLPVFSYFRSLVLETQFTIEDQQP